MLTYFRAPLLSLAMAIVTIAPCSAQSQPNQIVPAKKEGVNVNHTPRLMAITFSKHTSVVGGSVKLMLRITHPAPLGGFPLVLKSSSSSVRLPKVIKIPAGATAICLTVNLPKSAKPQSLSVKVAEFADFATRRPELVNYHTATMKVTTRKGAAK